MVDQVCQGLESLKELGDQMLAQFTPVETFQALIHGCRNSYLEGETYHVRDGNDQLLKAALRWRQEGMIVLTMANKQGNMPGALRAQPAETTGTARVT